MLMTVAMLLMPAFKLLKGYVLMMNSPRFSVK
jgi:hypothetical protein